MIGQLLNLAHSRYCYCFRLRCCDLHHRVGNLESSRMGGNDLIQEFSEKHGVCRGRMNNATTPLLHDILT